MVVVDEEAIGSVDRRGDDALDQYIRRTNVMNLRVRCCQARNSNTVNFLPYMAGQKHIIPLMFIFVLLWYYVISL